MDNIAAYVAVAIVGVLVTLVANVPARIISVRVGYTAQPDARKVHQTVTPYGGGAAMMVGFCVSLLAAMAVPSLRAIITSSNEMMGVLLATGVIFVVGVLDDFREMSAPAKVAGQCLAAAHRVEAYRHDPRHSGRCQHCREERRVFQQYADVRRLGRVQTRTQRRRNRGGVLNMIAPAGKRVFEIDPSVVDLSQRY